MVRSKARVRWVGQFRFGFLSETYDVVDVLLGHVIKRSLTARPPRSLGITSTMLA